MIFLVVFLWWSRWELNLQKFPGWPLPAPRLLLEFQADPLRRRKDGQTASSPRNSGEKEWKNRIFWNGPQFGSWKMENSWKLREISMIQRWYIKLLRVDAIQGGWLWKVPPRSLGPKAITLASHEEVPRQVWSSISGSWMVDAFWLLPKDDMFTVQRTESIKSQWIHVLMRDIRGLFMVTVFWCLWKEWHPVARFVVPGYI